MTSTLMSITCTLDLGNPAYIYVTFGKSKVNVRFF